MKRLRTVLLILLAVVAVIAAGAWLMRERLAMAAMDRAYRAGMAADPMAGLTDGLHVGLCGTGSPMPDPTRAGPCVAVVAGRQLFVVDTGQGSTRNLSLMNLPPGRVEALLLTHTHSDHIADLGELMLQRWAAGGRADPLPVYGAAGIEPVVAGFISAYVADQGYRVAHHGAATVPPSGFGGQPRPFAVPASGRVLLIDRDGARVYAFKVDHQPVEGAVGYLFQYKGRSVVVSGDTKASPNLEAAAKGVDVLFHEGLATHMVALQREAAVAANRPKLMKILADIPDYHATPVEAAAIAQRAGVKALVFYHTIPPLPARALEGVFLKGTREAFDGPIAVGHDGDFISLPAESDEIIRSRRFQRLR